MEAELIKGIEFLKSIYADKKVLYISNDTELVSAACIVENELNSLKSELLNWAIRNDDIDMYSLVAKELHKNGFYDNGEERIYFESFVDYLDIEFINLDKKIDAIQNKVNYDFYFNNEEYKSFWFCGDLGDKYEAFLKNKKK